MPTRIIRQGINDSEAINSLSWRGENLYRRLMLEVDDFGRYENSPRLIRAKVFAHQLDRWTDEDVLNSIKECSETTVHAAGGSFPLFTLYRVGGKSYLQINNFGQRIRSGQKSKYPDPPKTPASRGKSPRVPGNYSAARKIPAYSESEPKAESEVTLSAADAADMAALAFDFSDEERTEACPAVVMPGIPKAEFDQIAERIHARHPAVRRCSLNVVKKKLEIIAKKTPTGQRLALLRVIETNHTACCELYDWQKENGQFAKGLSNWLAPAGDLWSDPPARASPVERPGHLNQNLTTD